MNKNDDYKNGIKLLLKASKEENFPIRNFKWVTYFSNELAKKDLCEKFWKNTIKQNNLQRIGKCHSIYDTMHTRGSSLFIWDFAAEGHTFWDLKLHELFERERIKKSFEKLGWY